MTGINDRLEELSIVLPPAPAPVASYVPAVCSGNLLMTSGQIPTVAGQLVATGPVPSACSEPEAKSAARQCMINALAVIRDSLDGDLDRITRILRIRVYIASDAGFTGQSTVADGASDLLHELLGDRGLHARSAVGVSSLPLGASVELDVLTEVDG